MVAQGAGSIGSQANDVAADGGIRHLANPNRNAAQGVGADDVPLARHCAANAVEARPIFQYYAFGVITQGKLPRDVRTQKIAADDVVIGVGFDDVDAVQPIVADDIAVTGLRAANDVPARAATNADTIVIVAKLGEAADQVNPTGAAVGRFGQIARIRSDEQRLILGITGREGQRAVETVDPDERPTTSRIGSFVNTSPIGDDE